MEHWLSLLASPPACLWLQYLPTNPRPSQRKMPPVPNGHWPQTEYHRPTPRPSFAILICTICLPTFRHPCHLLCPSNGRHSSNCPNTMRDWCSETSNWQHPNSVRVTY
ncbi:hypothetical protein DL89DRAFT_151187 [Linderina pennispora]|uniref:Uncharacterized protein n=1 Tax=Linderina pennispora TaxID=61395 RepID=A0A1Y1W9B4_9FUNG|nr:uncharacterized protein DL89DRAFT_151187 [Linderina pennispora]ORX70032.1 hypothetical protein DL89DRAFT_151187 [Linderina pennispora]